MNKISNSWSKEAPFLCWAVPDIERSYVSKIFRALSDKESGRIKYEGLRDLNRKTVGIEVEKREFDAFCRRVGIDPEQGLGEDALFEIYAQPGEPAHNHPRTRRRANCPFRWVFWAMIA